MAVRIRKDVFDKTVCGKVAGRCPACVDMRLVVYYSGIDFENIRCNGCGFLYVEYSKRVGGSYRPCEVAIHDYGGMGE